MRRSNYLLLSIVFVSLLCFSFAHAFLLGPSFAGVGADDPVAGSFIWSNPSNITAEDSSSASVTSGATSGGTPSDYLKATGFNFSLPLNATVIGVTAEIKRQDGGLFQTPHDSHVYLVKSGIIQTATTDQASTTLFWPASLTYMTYGSSTDLWGNSLMPLDVNNSGFGVAVSIVGDIGGPFSQYGGNVDAIRVSVSYTTPGFRMMASSNYAVQTDSINFSGGLSTSSSYAVQDTLGEVGTGVSTSTNYKVNAGYQQMSQSYIAISPSTSTSTLSSISGFTGGSSTASTTWTVITDNPAGYSISVKASNSPAMQGDHGDNIADYTPVGVVPDFEFATSSTESRFGFSPAGVDVAARYLNNGSICGTGVFSTFNYCWDGFATSSKVIAQGLNSNTPNGATTTAVYEVQIGNARNQTAGSYSATITVTAVTL